MKLVKEAQVSEDLQYHLDENLALAENVFRAGSTKYFSMFNEVRALAEAGCIELNEDDKMFIFETEIGELAHYKGELVHLDFPIPEEGELDEYKNYQPEPFATQAAHFYDMLDAYKEGNLEKFYKNLVPKLKGSALRAVEYFKQFIEDNADRLTEGKLDSDLKKELVRKLMKAAQGASAEKHISRLVDDLEAKLLGSDKSGTVVRYVHGKRVDEAEYQGKEVDLNKPKRGGTKKFYVYTRNPKSGNVVKVAFGAKDGGGNLAVKLKDPKARKAFADRHDCKNKTDKTKPSYWSCRLPSYAKALGLSQTGARWW